MRKAERSRRIHAYSTEADPTPAAPSLSAALRNILASPIIYQPLSGYLVPASRLFTMVASAVVNFHMILDIPAYIHSTSEWSSRISSKYYIGKVPGSKRRLGMAMEMGKCRSCL